MKREGGAARRGLLSVVGGRWAVTSVAGEILFLEILVGLLVAVDHDPGRFDAIVLEETDDLPASFITPPWRRFA